ncbi:MAG: type II toxin-antitoxin system prevent-host-death family antitoxin [Kiritimatiellae bacterium]|nr:type II toxin-antitoxin system prevent-host-death family antitoxin [Kiritimatiellia bacterium]
MKSASISETKNHFSAYISAVRHGETIIVTDRRKPVARIEPVAGSGAAAAEGRAQRLQRQGILLPPRAGDLSRILKARPPRPRNQASALAVLLGEREEGR